MEGSQTATASEFRNDSGGIFGVQKRNADNKLRGIAVPKGETVWLTEDEQVATANAPRRPDDNPFTCGHLTLVTKQGELKHRRPIGDSLPEVETGVEPSEEEPQSAPEPAEGERAPGEEVGTETEEAKAAADAKAAKRAEAAQQQQKAADEKAKTAAVRSTQPPVPPDQGQAKPAAPQQRPQGSRATGEVVADPAPKG